MRRGAVDGGALDALGGAGHAVELEGLLARIVEGAEEEDLDSAVGEHDRSPVHEGRRLHGVRDRVARAHPADEQVAAGLPGVEAGLHDDPLEAVGEGGGLVGVLRVHVERGEGR